MLPKVAVLILNWNGRKWLAQFLPSVVASTYPNLEIWVIDNGSTDDSIPYTQLHFPSIKILPLGKNHGFTQGNNLALSHIDAPYFILLNSDVEVSPDWVQPLVALAEEDKQIAAVQPKILWQLEKDSFEYAGGAGGMIDSLGYPFCRGRIFETLEKDEGQYDTPTEIFWASGACCLIRKSVTDAIGLFESSYFAHMEEIDFCWRAKNKGYKIYYQPTSHVWHVGGGTLPKSNPRKLQLNIRNSLSTLLRNLPTVEVFPKIFFRLILDGVLALTLLRKGEWQSIWAIAKAHFEFYKLIPKWVRARSSPSPQKNLIGMYRGSIVWQYYIRKIKTFHQLKA